jgi:hypothetical protein
LSRRAPQKKKAMESINSRLALVMKSGKYCLGYKSTLKTLRRGQGVCSRCASPLSRPRAPCASPAPTLTRRRRAHLPSCSLPGYHRGELPAAHEVGD